MPNRNYVQGRAKEYRVMKSLRETGWELVMRTAGSHGMFDVIAVNPETKEIRLIQCKAGESSKREIRKLHSTLLRFAGFYTVEAYAI